MSATVRVLFSLIAGVGIATILGNAALADTKKIPFKINEPTALRLVVEATGDPPGVFEYEGDNSPMSPPFFTYGGLGAEAGFFGFFAVNPWTGDVWELRSCKRLSTAILHRSQAEIRKRFAPEERKLHARLGQLHPRCF